MFPFRLGGGGGGGRGEEFVEDSVEQAKKAQISIDWVRVTMTDSRAL